MDLMISKVVINQVDILATIDLMNQRARKTVSDMMSNLDHQFYDAQHKFRVVGIIGLSILLLAIVVLIIRIINGQNLLEGLLKHREIQYKTVVDTVKDGIITMSEAGVISSFNHAAEAIFGYTEAEVLDWDFCHLIKKNNHHLFNDYLASILNHSTVAEQELSAYCQDGKKITITITLTETGSKDNQHLTALVRDVTEEKASYEALLKYRDVFKHSNNALAFIDRDNIYQMVNDRYLQLLDKKEAQVIGHTVTEVVRGEWLTCCRK